MNTALYGFLFALAVIGVIEAAPRSWRTCAGGFLVALTAAIILLQLFGAL